MNIKTRIFIPMIMLTVVSCIAVLISSIILYNTALDDMMQRQVDFSMDVVERELDDIRTQVRLAAIGMASNNELAEAIINEDRTAVIDLVYVMEAMVSLDYCTVIGGDGKVIFRTNQPESFDDDVSHLPHISRAFRGEISAYVFQGVTVNLGMSAGAPIYDSERNIIGVISAGRRLDTQQISQNLKDLTSCEVTIFRDNLRVSTTVVDEEGEFAIGTHAAESISRKVLAGDHVNEKIILFGEEILAKYSPLYGANDTIVGMVFVGYYTADYTEKAMLFIVYGVFITLAVLAVCLVIASIVSGAIDQRQKALMDEISEARDVAKAASLAKSTFLANMSHEIRTPMNSIVGFSELATDDDIPPRTKDYLGKITENAKWLLQIINDILDISKIESGKMELEKVPFDLGNLLAVSRTIITPKADEKNLELRYYAEPTTAKTPLGDPTRLLQVLINLMSNAVRFTETGAIKINAVIKGMDDDTVTILFEVKDSGIGMMPDQIQRIFEPFTQAESGTTRKYGGTGLGLAITRNIVEMMGGELCVVSEPGVGSEFSFELTFETIDCEAEDYIKTIVADMHKPTFSGEILLCEDNPMNQQVICEHLARVGLRTVVAENGQIGVDIVKRRQEKGEKQFDLIFMDMHMPVMDGLDATERIMELNVNIPIVAMTASIMSNDREKYEMRGVNDYVGKPFTSQELWRCLMRYFKPLDWETEDSASRSRVDSELKQKLIDRFVASNQGLFIEITGALDTGDITLAHRLVHTLKSNAGQLKLSALHDAAAEVEICLQDGHDETTTHQMEALETELNAALAELEPIISDVIPHTQAEALDKEARLNALGLLEMIEPLMEDGNPECLKFVDKLRSIPGSGQLISQMEEFEFESAVETLSELKKELASSDQ